MYVKPAVQRYGSLRELTLIGCGSDGDPGLAGWLAGNLDSCLTGSRS
jgi:hypothetical protein